VATKSSGGCSTGGDDPGSGNLVALALLPLAIWMRRRWQLQRVSVRRRK
jgi:MYXO-CTERM domain-containing protein